MKKPDFKKIENKWQRYWQAKKIYQTKDFQKGKKNFMLLTEFPYPSGNLHIGHWYAFAVPDILARYLKMKGYNMSYPMGFDAFGLPAENAAIKRKLNPRGWTESNIKYMTKQLKSMGASFDWPRQVSTINPDYYKWTQWFFLKMFEKGLAYRAKTFVNWCPKCKTVLANEQVINGQCERCDSEVAQKEKTQWLFKITDYADRLIDDIKGLDWPETTKLAQRNWIGRSEGAVVQFSILNSQFSVDVFTTRVDTIFGCTYVVVAPEHDLIKNLEFRIENLGEVKKYVESAKKKLERERLMEDKQKTGVELKGIKAINPFTKKEVPVFVADYVLGHYGTGAVMAVPAHDERDFEFAKKYNLSIRQSIAPHNVDENNPPREGMENTVRKVVHVILENSKGEVLTLNLKGDEWGIDKPKTFIIGGIEGNESPKTAALREIKEETGYTDIEIVKIYPIEFHAEFYAAHKKVNRYVKTTGIVCKLKSEDRASISKEEEKLHNIVWVKKDILTGAVNIPDDIFFANAYIQNNETYTNDGVLVNSEKYSRLTSIQARKGMTKWLKENNLGGPKKTYKLHDWVISRQRYWGAPIPLIFCEHCKKSMENSKYQILNSKQIQNSKLKNKKTDFNLGEQVSPGYFSVPERDLPVKLPELKNFLPTDAGESPLARAKNWVKTKCPKCGAAAERETDTMDTFVDSSWYFIRYADPKNKKKFAAPAKMKKWLPIPMYIGGAEHNTMHLLYSRFFTKALYDLKLVHFNEPFVGRRNHGTILGPDNQKMSKSRGNVVDPDKEVVKFGADSVRMYLAFMGPYEQDGPWQLNGIIGIYRFLNRIYNFYDRDAKQRTHTNSAKDFSGHSDKFLVLNRLLHQTIKKAGEDIEQMRFNTAISALMILFNAMEERQFSNSAIQQFLILLSPFAPHLTEEIWHQLGNKQSIHLEKWPQYDKKLIQEEELELIIQINGKLRDLIKIKKGLSENECKNLALNSQKIKNAIAGKEIKRIIFVPDKLINIVV